MNTNRCATFPASLEFPVAAACHGGPHDRSHRRTGGERIAELSPNARQVVFEDQARDSFVEKEAEFSMNTQAG